MKKINPSQIIGKLRIYMYSKFKKNKFLFIGLVSILLLSLSIVDSSMANQPNVTSNSTNNTSLKHIKTNNSYSVTVIDNNTGGNVSQNRAFMQYIPNTELNNEIVAAAENGTPMVTFGNGSQPHVMITAGVHGAELPSQIAAIKLINDLSTTKIEGTIYIIPIVAPYDTAANTRLYHGQNLNIITRTPGSPTNIIIQTAVKNNVTYLGDFHSSQPNDVPGKNCVLYYSTNSSYNLSKYVANNTNVPLIQITPYPGLETTVSETDGINSFTCEVLSPHGTVQNGSSELAYQYMVSYLKFTGFLNMN